MPAVLLADDERLRAMLDAAAAPALNPAVRPHRLGAAAVRLRPRARPRQRRFHAVDDRPPLRVVL
eukprot:1457259-Prymnesium_polylepis.1